MIISPGSHPDTAEPADIYFTGNMQKCAGTKRRHLEDGPKGSRAEHPDLPELCLLQDPQQRLVGGLTTRGQWLHQLQKHQQDSFQFVFSCSVFKPLSFCQLVVFNHSESQTESCDNNLLLLQQAAQSPLSLDFTSP